MWFLFTHMTSISFVVRYNFTVNQTHGYTLLLSIPKKEKEKEEFVRYFNFKLTLITVPFS